MRGPFDEAAPIRLRELLILDNELRQNGDISAENPMPLHEQAREDLANLLDRLTDLDQIRQHQALIIARRDTENAELRAELAGIAWSVAAVEAIAALEVHGGEFVDAAHLYRILRKPIPAPIDHAANIRSRADIMRSVGAEPDDGKDLDHD